VRCRFRSPANLPRAAVFNRRQQATLRRTSLREQVSAWGLGGPGSRKVLELLDAAAALAA
jgi:hypothetical protein